MPNVHSYEPGLAERIRQRAREMQRQSAVDSNWIVDWTSSSPTVGTPLPAPIATVNDEMEYTVTPDAIIDESTLMEFKNPYNSFKIVKRKVTKSEPKQKITFPMYQVKYPDSISYQVEMLREQNLRDGQKRGWQRIQSFSTFEQAYTYFTGSDFKYNLAHSYNSKQARITEKYTTRSFPRARLVPVFYLLKG